MVNAYYTSNRGNPPRANREAGPGSVLEVLPERSTAAMPCGRHSRGGWSPGRRAKMSRDWVWVMEDLAAGRLPARALVKWVREHLVER